MWTDKAFRFLFLLVCGYLLVACTAAELAVNMYQDCTYRNNRDGLCVPGVTHVTEWLGGSK